jgi:transcriptional regulator with XRE-family HTH domain
MSKSAAVRTCGSCGRTLSKYNTEPICGSCARQPPTRSPVLSSTEPWLSRAHLTGSDGDDVGAVLRAYRLASGLSQAKLAGALDMTQQNLSQLEAGRSPSIEQRRKIVEVLGLAPEDLGLASRPAQGLAADDQAVAESRARWRAERRWLNHHRSEMARLAVELYPDEWRVPRTPLIATPQWSVSEPVELRSLALDLDESPHAITVNGSEPQSARVRPLRSTGVRFDRYTAAVKHLDPPQLFESRPSYRLLDVSLGDRRIGFGMAAYFDKLDVSEALGHEMALACMGAGSPPAALDGLLPFRHVVGNPFATDRRAIVPAITTLTIRLRRHPDPPTFLLHWRDPAKVATAAGIYDVIPAGEFQPSSVALWDRRADFDLWRNVVREYAEELLGAPEHDGTRSAPIDYDSWPLYLELDQAFAQGTLSAHFLGLALDALTLAATILTVVVVDDDVFERTFGDAVRYNDEGEIVAIGDGRVTEGIPFTQPAVDRLLTSEPLASPGAGCLALAWQHRSQLLGL